MVMSKRYEFDTTIHILSAFLMLEVKSDLKVFTKKKTKKNFKYLSIISIFVLQFKSESQ